MNSNDLNINYVTGINANEFKNNKINIFCLNIRSIRNKFEEFINFIDSQEFLIQIIVLTEVWIYSNENDDYKINNYEMFASNRDNARAGGVIIYVHNSMQANCSKSVCVNNNNFLLVDIPNHKIKILGVYRQPVSNIEQFINYLDEFISANKNCVILGDMNINILNDNSTTVMNYINMINSNGFCILNNLNDNFATRFSNTINTIIDHVITDLVHFKYFLSVSKNHLSDHCFLLLNLDNSNKNVTESKIKTIIDYKNIDDNNLCNSLENTNNFNEFVHELENIIKSNTKEFKINKKNQNKKEWINSNITHLINNRDFFYDLWKRFHHVQYYKDQFFYFKKKCFTEIRKSKREYFAKHIDNSSKNMWKVVNTAILNKNKSTSISLKVDNNMVNDEFLVANHFNKYFTNIAKEISGNINSSNSFEDYLKPYNIVSNFEFDPTDKNEVEKIIKNLNSNSAAGIDKISVKFIKRYKNQLSETIAKLINNVFETGIFPSCFKAALVTPIFKKGSKFNLENYRPISVICTISKIIEIIMYLRLLNFLNNNKVINENQFGFIEKSSTAAAVIQLLNKVRKGLDQKKIVAAVSVDLKKAFDTVNHDILVKKLFHAGIQNPVHINLFKSYLHERFQKVKINGVTSNNLIINSGVPQGSVLGPLLFNFYVNDLFKLDLKGTISLYADDMIILYEVDNLLTLHELMEHDLKLLNEWLEANLMSINVDKTNYIVFNAKNKLLNLETFTLQLNNSVINRVNCTKYLGLLIDEKLSWSDHIVQIKNKLNRSIFALRKLCNVLPTKAKWAFFYSHILSHVSYLNPIWNSASQNHISSIKTCVNRAIKIIRKLPVLHHTDDLYSERLLPFNLYNKYNSILLMFKIQNNLIKHNFSIIYTSDVHSHNTRNNSRNNIYINSTNTTVASNDVLNISSNLFNLLPIELKNETRISIFKTKLKKFLYVN